MARASDLRENLIQEGRCYGREGTLPEFVLLNIFSLHFQFSVTNGGKSTLAGKLKKLFPNCTIISQDDFFKPESEVAKDDRGFLQYDVLDALYMETMVASIRSWMTKPEDSALPRPPNNTHDDHTGAKDIRVLIIEGFLLFNYKPLSDIWDKKYFLTIPYEECKRRRSNRIYSPPDPPGYFDGHVWPMYQKHRREMEENEASIGTANILIVLTGV
ncbi:Nicotinamide riboside kinase 1, partial [Ophiophagus hannah]